MSPSKSAKSGFSMVQFLWHCPWASQIVHFCWSPLSAFCSMCTISLTYEVKVVNKQIQSSRPMLLLQLSDCCSCSVWGMCSGELSLSFVPINSCRHWLCMNVCLNLWTTVLQSLVRHQSHFLVVELTVQQSQLLIHMIPLHYTFSFVKPFLVQFFLKNTRLVYWMK